MKFKCFSKTYRYSDIVLKRQALFIFNHTSYCVNMVSVTSASRYITSASCYHPGHQSRSSMKYPWFDDTEFHGIGRGFSDWLTYKIAGFIRAGLQ